MIFLVLPALASAGFFSEHIEKYLDHSVDPCDDFYDHVCTTAVKNNNFVIEHRKESFYKVLEQLYLPKMLEFYKRAVNDVSNLADEMYQQDVEAVELLIEKTGFNCILSEENPFFALDAIINYDAFHRLQNTPHYNHLKKKMTDIFVVLKEIIVKELEETPWTAKRPVLLNLLKNLTLVHLEAKDFNMETESRKMIERYDECMGIATSKSKSLASMCINYAVCPIKRKIKYFLATDQYQSQYWNNFQLIYQAYYVPSKNVVLPSPMFYTLEEDDLPYMLGSVDYILGHEVGHVFFNEYTGAVPSNSECVRRHMKNTCDEYFNQSICTYDGIGVHGDYSRLGEDGADWVGVYASLKAFKNYYPSIFGNNSSIESIEITKKFFYGNAIHWCYPSPERADRTHSPLKVRVNGIHSLFSEFSEVFQCKRGSKMAKAGTCLPLAGVGAPSQVRDRVLSRNSNHLNDLH